MADQPSPRRRFQFRLRTLMIGVTLLAIPCGYVGWQAKIVRDREAGIKRLDALQCRYCVFGVDPIKHGARFEPSTTWLRRLLGDCDLFAIFVPNDRDFTDEELAQVRRLFPEADIDDNAGHVLSGNAPNSHD